MKSQVVKQPFNIGDVYKKKKIMNPCNLPQKGCLYQDNIIFAEVGK